MSKQLNYGDLSRFVGKPVGQQFAKKRYAEGETVAEELTGSVTYEDINGKKRTYLYNPDTHTKPQPSGRMRRTNIDYTQLANNPGMNIFDRATLAEEPAAVIARQQQDVPVSVAEDFWTDSDIDTIGDFVDNKQGGQGTGPGAMKDAEKRAATAAKIGMMLPFGGLGGLAPRIASNMSWGFTKDEIDKGIGAELLGLTDKGERDKTKDVTVAAFEEQLKGKESYYKDKGGDEDKGIGGGTNKKDAYSRARASQLLQDLYGQGKSLTKDLSKETLTQEDINNIMGGTGNQSGKDSPNITTGGWGQAASAINPETGNFIEDEQQAAAANQARVDAGGFSFDEDSLTTEYDDEGNVGYTSMDIGYKSGGIAQLAPGGIAPSDKHLDPGSFVISADVVSGVGDGSTESGIERMSGLLGIPLDGSVSGPDGSMLGRVTTADGGPVPGTGLSDSVSTVIQDTSPVRLNVGNNPLKQMTPQGKTAARVARDELVVDTRTIANLPQMFMGAKGPDLKQGQQMLTNFMDNVRANKTNTGGKQPGPLVPEGQDVMKGLASLFQRA